MILVGSEPVWLLTYAFAYFFSACFVIYVYFHFEVLLLMLCFRVLTLERRSVSQGLFFLFSGPPCYFILARGSLRNTGRHVDFRAVRYRCFDHRRHQSLESDAQDDQMPPRDPEDVTWAHKPQDLILSIFDICDTKFMSDDINGH